MSESPRKELLAIQRKLWKLNKQIIEDSVLVKEPGFGAYEKAYHKDVARYTRIADEDEMLKKVLSSDIIYVGDYHTCNQSQRSFLRILKAIVKHDNNFVVGLELLHKSHQKVLDKYFSDKINEKTFLNKIKLEEHWVFDLWENFKPLFDFCRYHHVSLFAIDAAPKGSYVRVRDRASAKLIADVISENPKKRFFVFIGDLHIAPPHLPNDVRRELSRRKIKKTDIKLYENSEAIYWQLARDGIDDYVEVVKLPDGSFCRMHTPPIVCQRSYLNWLEHEEGEIDYADAKMSFLEIVDRIAEFLDIKLGKMRDEIEIFTSGDLSFLKHLEERGDFSKSELRIIKKQIFASESYYIAKAKVVYLANLSINHAAEEASHFIKSVCSGPEKPRFIVDAFYANILHEALGFFGSKLINHKRKCFHKREFESLLKYFAAVKVPKERRLELETARFVLEYLSFEKKGKHLSHEEIFRSRTDLFLSLTHALGYMLGDRLYYGLMEGVVSKSEIRELFVDHWADDGGPVDVYMKLSTRLKKVKIPKRM